MTLDPNIEMKTIHYANGDVSHVNIEGDVVKIEGTNAEINSTNLAVNAKTQINNDLIIQDRVGQSNDLELRGGQLLVGGPVQGRVKIRDAAGNPRIDCHGQSGTVTLRSPSNNPITTIKSTGEIAAGRAAQTQGKVCLMDGGETRLMLDADDGGSLRIQDQQAEHIAMQQGQLTLGRQGLGGRVKIQSEQHVNRTIVEMSPNGIEVNHEASMRTRIGGDGLEVGGTGLAGKIRATYMEGRPFVALDGENKEITVTPEEPGANPTLHFRAEGELKIGNEDFPGSIQVKDKRNRTKVIIRGQGEKVLHTHDESGNPMLQVNTTDMQLGSQSQKKKMVFSPTKGHILILDPKEKVVASLDDQGRLGLEDPQIGASLSQSATRGLVHEHSHATLVISAENLQGWPAWPGETPTRTLNLLDEVRILKEKCITLERNLRALEDKVSHYAELIHELP